MVWLHAIGMSWQCKLKKLSRWQLNHIDATLGIWNNQTMNSLNGHDDQELYESVRSILRSGKLTPEVLANFIYNRRQKFTKGPYYMTDFSACELQFKSLINQHALANSRKSDSWPEINVDTSLKISDVAEEAFGIFSTWKWETL